MYQKAVSNLPSERCIPCRMILLLAWTLGLVCGIAYAYHASDSFSSLMLRAIKSPVSIVGMVVIHTLPFLLSAFAVFISRTELLIPLAFLKAFSFSACAFSVDLVFRSAGWLIRSLLMLSDFVALPVLLWFWMRHMDGEHKGLLPDLSICAGIMGLAVTLESCYISPFLAMIV